MRAKIINMIMGLIILLRNKPNLNHNILGMVSSFGFKIVNIANTVEIIIQIRDKLKSS